MSRPDSELPSLADPNRPSSQTTIDMNSPDADEEVSGDSFSAETSEANGGRSGRRSPSAVRNALLNWVGLGAEAVVAFLLTPFLVGQLGQETYGVWFLIGSLAGYFGMLDFGLNNSIGRFIAFYRGRGDHDGVLRTLNTAAAILTVVGIVAFCLIGATSFGLHLIFEIPAAELSAARAALVIVGANLSLSFIFAAFDSVLWAYERFDLRNLVDISGSVLRALITVMLVREGFGLKGLALASVIVVFVTGVSKAGLCCAVARPVEFSWRLVQFSTFRELAPFGFWQFVVSSSRMARQHIYPTIIGSMLGPAVVTAYSIIVRLVGYAVLGLATTVNVVAPRLVTFVGQNDTAGQSAIMMPSGRLCTAFSTCAVAGVILLGHPFLSLWMGPDLATAWKPLSILAIGEWLPMVVQPHAMAVFANARQRAVAWRGVAECIVGLSLGAILGRYWGLNGFVCGFSIAATWYRGIFMLKYVGDMLDVPGLEYLRQAVAPVVVRGILPVGLFAVIVRWREPSTWPEFCAYVAAFSILFWGCQLQLAAEFIARRRNARSRLPVSSVTVL